MANLAVVVRLLKKEQDRLSKELQGVKAALAAFGKASSKGARTRRLSAAGRARIAAAQKARWAKVRAAAKVVPIRGKRMPSAAAQKKITAVRRARRVRVNAAKKTG